MKIRIIWCGLIFISLSFGQELQRAEYVHGPLDYYAYKIGKFGSQVIPPLFTTYKVLMCEGATCPDSMGLGIAGIVWAAAMFALHKIDTCHPMQKEQAECTVYELLCLIADFPEVLDTLSERKKRISTGCLVEQVKMRKLSFTIAELEKMFGGYDAYYGFDCNNKPCGQIRVDDEQIHHPLITAWAKNKHYWKHW